VDFAFQSLPGFFEGTAGTPKHQGE
jgi:hypothetical protein